MGQVKARRWYWTRGNPFVKPERVRVTGWDDVNGEQWCRVRFEGEKTAGILMHPSNIDAERVCE